jgi:hypothetical protein
MAVGNRPAPQARRFCFRHAKHTQQKNPILWRARGLFDSVFPLVAFFHIANISLFPRPWFLARAQLRQTQRLPTTPPKKHPTFAGFFFPRSRSRGGRSSSSSSPPLDALRRLNAVDAAFVAFRVVHYAPF